MVNVISLTHHEALGTIDDHLQVDQHGGARELHGTDDRERMQQVLVIAEPENEIDEDSERRCMQGGRGTGSGCLSDGTKGALCDHLSSSHLVAMMPRTKTTAAKTPMIAASRSAAMLSSNTIAARSPSFT